MMYVGMDLGQSSDFTALSFIQAVEVVEKPPMFVVGDPKIERHYHVRHLYRFHRGMPYPKMIEDTTRFVRSLSMSYRLICDATGVGAAVFDMLRDADLKPVGISIHGGVNVTHEGGKIGVPKRDLASTLKVLAQSRRLHIRRELKEAEALKKELRSFTQKIDVMTGHDSYEHFRDAEHDDLVLSIAMALWYAERNKIPDWSKARPIHRHY